MLGYNQALANFEMTMIKRKQLASILDSIYHKITVAR